MWRFYGAKHRPPDSALDCSSKSRWSSYFPHAIDSQSVGRSSLRHLPERASSRGQRLAPVVRSAVKEYAASRGISLNQKYDAETISGGMSLVASTGSLMLLPLYVTKMLVPSVVARPLEGEPPTVDLVMGYNKSNTSTLLRRFLTRADDLVAGVQKQDTKSESNRISLPRSVVKGG